MTDVVCSPTVMAMVAFALSEAAQSLDVPEHVRVECAALSKAIIASTRDDGETPWRLTREVGP